MLFVFPDFLADILSKLLLWVFEKGENTFQPPVCNVTLYEWMAWRLQASTLLYQLFIINIEAKPIRYKKDGMPLLKHKENAKRSESDFEGTEKGPVIVSILDPILYYEYRNRQSHYQEIWS